MDIKDKIKKPWWCPSWLWNLLIEGAAEKAKESLTPENIASLAAQGEALLIKKAIRGKDPATIKRIMRVCNSASGHVSLITRALDDGIFSPEEEKELSDSLALIAAEYFDAEAVSAKIDEIASLVKKGGV